MMKIAKITAAVLMLFTLTACAVRQKYTSGLTNGVVATTEFKAEDGMTMRPEGTTLIVKKDNENVIALFYITKDVFYDMAESIKDSEAEIVESTEKKVVYKLAHDGINEYSAILLVDDDTACVVSGEITETNTEETIVKAINNLVIKTKHAKTEADESEKG